jgi:phosphocarrier protein
MTNETENTLVIELEVTNELGLHARVATRIVQIMQKLRCQVTLAKDGVEANASSVLGLLMLAASPGTVIEARAKGPDSELAIQQISRLIQDEDID